MKMKYRFATIKDIPILATMNKQLTEDEQHRHRFESEQWFMERMTQLLNDDYTAVLFEKEIIVAYALYRNHPDHADTIYLRQLFVSRDYRRQGIGKEVLNDITKNIRRTYCPMWNELRYLQSLPCVC